MGGYIAQSGIVVAQTSTGVYAAVTQTRSHEPRKNVVFNETEFYCTVYGARFDLTGKGKTALGASWGLKLSIGVRLHYFAGDQVIVRAFYRYYIND